MSLFFMTFVALYGLMHLYFFLKANAAFHFSGPAGTVMVLFFVAMVAAPILVRGAERGGYAVSARVLAHAGYTWMGFLFLFVCIALAHDLTSLGIRLTAHFSGSDPSRFLPGAGASFRGIFVAALLISLYGLYEARHVRTERVTIRTPKLPPGKRIVVAQVSDIHLGLMVRTRRLSTITDILRRERPDLIVSTGDLVDGQMVDLSDVGKLLDDLRPPLGKFAITGNHEYYAGIEQAEKFTRSAGFRILRGESTLVGDSLALAGEDDPVGKRFGDLTPESDILGHVPTDRFTILLKHRPAFDEKSRGKFGLQLSGHVHNGQIFPFSLVTRLVYPIPVGLSTLPGGAQIYVSPGSGTWGPPMRVLAPPEVTIIEIVSSR